MESQVWLGNRRNENAVFCFWECWRKNWNGGVGRKEKLEFEVHVSHGSDIHSRIVRSESLEKGMNQSY